MMKNTILQLAPNKSLPFSERPRATWKTYKATLNCNITSDVKKKKGGADRATRKLHTNDPAKPLLEPERKAPKNIRPRIMEAGACEQTCVNEKQLKPEMSSIGFEASRHERGNSKPGQKA
jgi:hypothetical protein